MAADDRVDHFLPLYVRDFLTATIGWTAEEKGHYLTLLMIQWDRGALPAELDRLERLSAGVSAVWAMLQDKFPVDGDGQRRNARLERHRDRALDLRHRRSEAARIAASTRFAKQTHSKRIADASQTHTDRTAIAMHPEPEPEPQPEPVSSAGAEDIQPAARVVATSVPPRRRKRSPHHEHVTWSMDRGWSGITPADRAAWCEAFPAVTLDVELVRATEWLKANPTRAKKSNWRRFLLSWLTRSQDRGGTNRVAGATAQDVAKKASVERKAREFAQLQPAPYRRPKEVAALADRLKVTERAS